ncbi:MAG TPA: MIP family channel protein [Actinomycetota bacterium]|nr:MIP family channel protein [Actinomycetota bacterium]
MKKVAEQMVAEFLGAFALIFIGAGVVVMLGPAAGPQGTPFPQSLVFLAIALVGIALAHGLVLGIMISNFGHISGGHYNPAVTISVWVAGKIETLRAGLYIVAQLAGAAAGAGLLSLAIPKRIWTLTHLGATLIGPQAKQLGFTTGRGVLLEAVLTFFLVITVFATAVDERGVFKSLGGMPIGLVLTFDILVGGFFTGASMNPARSFGPALISGTWTDFWVYLVGPITGGIIAATIYWFAFLRERPEMTVDEEVEPGDGPVDAEAGEPEPPYEQPLIAPEEPPAT